MIAPALVALGLAALGRTLESGFGWALADVRHQVSRETAARAQALWQNAIVHLAAVSTEGQSGALEVNVSGLPADSPNGLYTGFVIGSSTTAYKEGTALEFGWWNVLSVDA